MRFLKKNPFSEIMLDKDGSRLETKLTDLIFMLNVDYVKMVIILVIVTCYIVFFFIFISKSENNIN